MDSLDRFRTHRLARPPKQHVDLTITSASAVPVSPGPRSSSNTMQDLGLMSPGSKRFLHTNSQQYQGKHVHNKLQITEADRMFKLKLVETCADQVLRAELKDAVYHPNTCRELSQLIAGQIMERIKTFALTQYKLVCIVSIGSLKDRPAMQFGSRCLWNKDTDNFVSVKYTNSSIFAVAMIYGLYFD